MVNNVNVSVRLDNVFQLRAAVQAPGDEYAYYLYRDNEIVDKLWYTRERERTFNISEPGRYAVKGYVRHSGKSGISGISTEIDFRGLPEPAHRTRAEYSVVGVSEMSALAALILQNKQQVLGFLDPTNAMAGGKFFGLPVHRDPPVGARIIGHEACGASYRGMETFSLRVDNDVLSDELHAYGVMELYRLSRKLYLQGFVRGAKFIQETIRIRWACQLPFTVQIGAGTSLGYGGLATVIHPSSVIGKDCKIGQNVTIGMRAGKTDGAPRIGDNVFISPGARCLGGAIGSNVVVGAGAVVTRAVPDDCVVAGVPAKIISRDMSDYRKYTKTDS